MILFYIMAQPCSSNDDFNARIERLEQQCAEQRTEIENLKQLKAQDRQELIREVTLFIVKRINLHVSADVIKELQQ